MKRLLGVGERRSHQSPEQLDEDLAEIRRQGQEDLAALQIELDQRGPSEEEIRLQGLREKQKQLAIVRLRRRRRQKRARLMADPYAAAAAASATGEQPPEPWQALFDPHSRSVYFYNPETQVTTWDLPTMLNRPPDPEAPWRLVPHYSSSSWYYYNSSTGETSWDAPAEACQNVYGS